MRKESSNQFTEGLVCDLNPINTPNTVLTDALNATLITYNGNEFSLQNDRGNYPLENCKLKPNYIPVGLKEYGDILYIVSYNPLNNRVEIGSYPSPMEVIGTDNNCPELELNSVIGKIEKDIKYSELVELCETKIWTSDNEEDTKLYPGDEYKIQEEEKSPYKYETLEYFIIDENRQKYNISDLIEKDNQWHSVAWQIPGWLAAQYRIATFDDFIMGVRSMTIPKLGEGLVSGKLKLNFQLRISDFLFLPSSENEVKSDLYIRFEIEDKNPIDISIAEGKYIDWYKDSKILWMDWETELTNLKFGSTITFKATPVVKINGKEIIYNSFTESHSIYLNSIGSYSDFKIGEEIWKFYIDDDDLNNLYLEYNIVGPSVTSSDVQLYYRVLDLNEKPISEWGSVDNYTGITNQGVGIIPFKNGFEKEAIYVLEFCFADPKNPQYTNTIRKLIIASQIFSDFVGIYDNFNQIAFDEWILKYKNSVKSNNWRCVYSGNFKEGYRNFEWRNDSNLYLNGNLLNNPLKNIWSSKDAIDKGILTDSEYNNIKDVDITLVQGKQGTPIITIEHDLKTLEGRLWNNTPNITINASSIVDSVINTYSRSTTIPEKLKVNNLNVVNGQYKKFSHIKDLSFKYASGIEKIENVPILYLYATPWNKNANEGIYTSIYRLGDYNANRGEKFSINTTNPTKNPLIEDYRITEGYKKTPNEISNAIMSGLGTAHVAVMIVVTDSFNTGSGKFQLRHGQSPVFSSAGKDDADNHVYTYLVFRQTPTSKTPIFVPVNYDKDLWDYATGLNGKDKLEFNTTKLSNYISKLCTNIILCNQKNAVKSVNLVKIQESDAGNLSICDISVAAPEFSKWIYKVSESINFDLLNFNDRKRWNDKLSEKVCGKLLTGSIASIDGIEFYKTKIENTNTEDVDFTISSDSNSINVQSQIALINSKIKANESDGLLLDKIEKNVQTKGVYWMLGNNPEMIDVLNNGYAYSDDKILTMQSSSASDLNAYVTNDKDGIIYGLVTTNITGELDDKDQS